METSTTISKSQSNPVQSELSPQELSEEDQLFFSTIHEDLNKLEKKPSAATVKAILNHSKSL